LARLRGRKSAGTEHPLISITPTTWLAIAGMQATGWTAIVEELGSR
jgi:hypothetical protein